jgi:hypothetical protein
MLLSVNILPVDEVVAHHIWESVSTSQLLNDSILACRLGQPVCLIFTNVCSRAVVKFRVIYAPIAKFGFFVNLGVTEDRPIESRAS